MNQNEDAHRMTLTLQYNDAATVPLEVEGILPETVRERSIDAIQQMPVFHGNEKVPLGEFFQIRGDPTSERLEWQGDMTGVHWIGAKMTLGEIRVAGNAGRHVGSEMRGGTLHVAGNASDWVGGEMKGGLIDVRGNAGHLVGAAYRGSARGMSGGTILVRGKAGNELGHTMRRGLLVFGADIGDLAGFNMLAGTILVFGRGGIRHAAGMRRGTVGFFGEPPELLLSFRYACRYRPEMLRVLVRQLARHDFPLPDDLAGCQVDLYHGDLVTGGRGEMLLRKDA